jgi:fatty acid desaturase
VTATDTKSAVEHGQIKRLMGKRDFPGVCRLSQFFLAILGTGYLLALADHPFVQFLLILLLGILLTFLFAPLHESIHKTAFASSWINQVTAVVCGFLIFLPPKSFQAFHMAHHRYTQVARKDPELDIEKPETMLQYLWLMSGIPYWAGQFKALWKFSIDSHRVHYVNDARYPGIVWESRIYGIIYIALLLTSIHLESLFLWKYWILPLMLGQPFLRVFLVAEHAVCPRVRNMFQNTRTTLTNAPVRWLCWNMSFHTEHHAYPGIPFYQLPRAHVILKSRISKISNGYVTVNREIMGSF